MSAKCKICTKAVYPMDPQINLDGSKFHKTCAKCAECGCQITLSNFTKNESEDQTLLLCKIHYFKRFHEGGSYVGGDKYRIKSDRDVQNSIKSKDSPVNSKVNDDKVVVNESIVFKLPTTTTTTTTTTETPITIKPEPVVIDVVPPTVEEKDSEELLETKEDVDNEVVTTTETDEVATSDT